MVGLSIKRHDEIALEQSIGFVKYNLEQEFDLIKKTAQDYTWWTDSYDNLVMDFNEDWANTNIGLYLHDLHGMNLSFVVGPNDQTVYGQINGKRVHEDAFSIFSSGIKNLIDTARSTPALGAPVPAAGVLATGDDVALVGVSVIKPEDNAVRPPATGPASVLIGAKVLSPEALGKIEGRLPITQLSIVGNEPDGHLPLNDPMDIQIASLGWQAEKPGTDFVRSIWPSILGVLVVVTFFTIVVLWDVRRSAAKIEANEVRFRDVADASSDWIWETDDKLRFTYLSMRVMEDTEKTTREWHGQSIGKLFQPIAVSKQWHWVKEDAKQLASFRNF
ncbi:MAG: CHASE4 domain-containing protein, partial [Geminicoccaceae bacterium]